MTRHFLMALLLLAVMLWVGAYLYYRPAGMPMIGWTQPIPDWMNFRFCPESTADMKSRMRCGTYRV